MLSYLPSTNPVPVPSFELSHPFEVVPAPAPTPTPIENFPPLPPSSHSQQDVPSDIPYGVYLTMPPHPSSSQSRSPSHAGPSGLACHDSNARHDSNKENEFPLQNPL